MTDIASFNIEELKDFIISLGEKPFRAEQIFNWIHAGYVRSFDEMTNIPASLRARLTTECYLPSFETEKVLTSADGTKKYLFSTGNISMESVIMEYSHGKSACISTQAGCKMGCTFCASAGGFSRNLTASEMLSQVYEMEKDNGKISSVVLMGTGEPLDNTDNVLKFIELISHRQGKQLGVRHITLSTCGIVPEIIRLAGLRLQITLAISLHAPNDSLRANLMPVAKVYPLKNLIQASEIYFETTGRRVTFEYAVIPGVNDSPDCAFELIKLFTKLPVHVNLIPMNPVGENLGKYSKVSLNNAVKNFESMLQSNIIKSKKGNITITLRRTLGQDIDSACGQLRSANTEV